MVAFQVANLVLAVALLFWPVWFSKRILHLKGTDPFVVTMLLGMPIQVMRLFGGPLFLIEDGLFDSGYQYALWMGNLSTLAQTVGLVGALALFQAIRIEKSLPGGSIQLSPTTLRRAANFFLVVYAVSFYFLASAEFGLLNWLGNPRMGYQLYRTGQGHWYALAITALATSFLLRFLANPRRLGLVWIGTYLGLCLLFGSKGVLLAFFTSYLSFLWLTGSRNVTKIFWIGAPAAFMLMLWNLYLAFGDGLELASLFEYFDYYKNAADYYRGVLSGEIPLFGGEVSLTSYWAYVPRALWPDKPYVYGVLHINEIFFPGQAELTNTPDFGGAVEQYADFGAIGVVIFGLFSPKSLLLALGSYLIFVRPRVQLDRINACMLAALIVQLAPMFGQYFPGMLYALLLLAVMAVVLALRLGSRTQRRARAPDSALGKRREPAA